MHTQSDAGPRDDGSLGVGPWWTQLVVFTLLAFGSAMRVGEGGVLTPANVVLFVLEVGWIFVIVGAHYRWPWVQRIPGVHPAYGFDHQRKPGTTAKAVLVVLAVAAVSFLWVATA